MDAEKFSQVQLQQLLQAMPSCCCSPSSKLVVRREHQSLVELYTGPFQCSKKTYTPDGSARQTYNWSSDFGGLYGSRCIQRFKREIGTYAFVPTPQPALGIVS